MRDYIVTIRFADGDVVEHPVCAHDADEALHEARADVAEYLDPELAVVSYTARCEHMPTPMTMADLDRHLGNTTH